MSSALRCSTPAGSNIAFIGCQQQANPQRVVDDAHQILIRLRTEFCEFGLLCRGAHESLREKPCADSGAVAGLKDPVRSFKLLRRSSTRFGSGINGKDRGYKFMRQFGEVPAKPSSDEAIWRLARTTKKLGQYLALSELGSVLFDFLPGPGARRGIGGRHGESRKSPPRLLRDALQLWRVAAGSLKRA